MSIEMYVLAVLCLVGSCVANADCFTDAAKLHRVDENILRAIAKVESNYNPEAIHPKTHALGVMQIMPLHFKTLEKYGILESDLHQACTNINVGAWVLADFIRQYGPVWRAVGGYGVGNSKSKTAEIQRVIYAGKVQHALHRLLGHKYVTQPALNNSHNPEILVIE